MHRNIHGHYHTRIYQNPVWHLPVKLCTLTLKTDTLHYAIKFFIKFVVSGAGVIILTTPGAASDNKVVIMFSVNILKLFISLQPQPNSRCVSAGCQYGAPVRCLICDKQLQTSIAGNWLGPDGGHQLRYLVWPQN